LLVSRQTSIIFEVKHIQSDKVKAKETKKCHHRQLMSADAVMPIVTNEDTKVYGRSADATGPIGPLGPLHKLSSFVL
jgi:hypothetical protein